MADFAGDMQSIMAQFCALPNLEIRWFVTHTLINKQMDIIPTDDIVSFGVLRSITDTRITFQP